MGRCRLDRPRRLRVGEYTRGRGVARFAGRRDGRLAQYVRVEVESDDATWNSGCRARADRFSRQITVRACRVHGVAIYFRVRRVFTRAHHTPHTARAAPSAPHTPVENNLVSRTASLLPHVPTRPTVKMVLTGAGCKSAAAAAGRRRRRSSTCRSSCWADSWAA